jgi:hypothetical protein
MKLGSYGWLNCDSDGETSSSLRNVPHPVASCSLGSNISSSPLFLYKLSLTFLLETDVFSSQYESHMKQCVQGTQKCTFPSKSRWSFLSFQITVHSLH